MHWKELELTMLAMHNILIMHYAAFIYKMYMNMIKNKTYVLTLLHFETTCLERPHLCIWRGSLK